jgi:Ni/Fe-hydrogenase subunit HybB-like protein
MTLRPGWNSTIFGPYFVVGAIFSGIAAILIAMAIFRRVYHLEGYLTEKHFRYLGALLLVMDLIYIYFTLSEYLTMVYSYDVADARVLQMLFTGDFALVFWGMILGGLVLPAFMLAAPNLVKTPMPTPMAIPGLRPAFATAAVAVLGLVFLVPGVSASSDLQTLPILPLTRIIGIIAALGGLFWLALPFMRAHPIATIVTASIFINIAMWLKRYIIVVPTLNNPRIPMQGVPWEWAHYVPTWVEWSITAGAFAMFILLYALFSKLFPVISIWETSEEAHQSETIEPARRRRCKCVS